MRGVYDDGSVLVGIPARVVKRYKTDIEKWERVEL